jgi:phenylacetate-CoA ligase
MINWRKPIIYILSFLQVSKRMKYYNQILQYAEMSEEELKDLQQEKLSKMLLHAYENVPYYTKILGEARVIKGTEINLDNFEKIPVLTKDILKKDFENLERIHRIY